VTPATGGGGMLLEAVEVSVHIGGRAILEGINLTVGAGEIVGMMGANGAGKSTILDVLAGRRLPNAGRVRFDGLDVTGSIPRLRARRGLCLVPQGGRILEHLSVAEHLRIGALAARPEHGGTPSDLVGLIVEDLDPRTPCGDLTHPQRLQLELATVVATCPRLLLLDEPSAGLADADGRRAAMRLRAIRSALPGIGMLIVEHDEVFLDSVIDRMIVVADGRILAAAAR